MSSTPSPLNILQPGQRIKPRVTPETTKSWILQQYGVHVTRIKELNSYDDINYLVEGSRAPGNGDVDGNGNSGLSTKYVFKILNSLDSQNTSHIEAESECMLFLSKSANFGKPSV